MPIPPDAIPLVAKPNWRESYTVGYAFKTDIVTVGDGTEQRIARRRTPRKTLGFTATLSQARARLFSGQMAKNQGKRFLVPEHTLSQRMDADMPAGATVLPITVIPPWMAAGMFVALYDKDRFAAVTISTVAFGVVALDSPVGEAWSAAATRVAPARLGRVQPSFSGARHTATILEVPIQFTEEPGSEIYPLFFDEAFTQSALFHGRELFVLPPDWGQSPSVSYDTDLQQLDYDHGVIDYFNPENLRSKSTQFAFTEATRQSVKYATDFFFRMKGQQQSFYAPTWTSDMELSQEIVPGSNMLRMVGRDLYDYFSGPMGDRVHRNIVMRTGTALVPLSILDITLDSPESQVSTVQLALPIPAGITKAGVRMISWLPLCRMASDNLTVSWLTDGVAQFNLTFKTLPDAFDEIRLAGDQLTVAGWHITMAFNNELTAPRNKLFGTERVFLLADTYISIGGP